MTTKEKIAEFHDQLFDGKMSLEQNAKLLCDILVEIRESAEKLKKQADHQGETIVKLNNRLWATESRLQKHETTYHVGFDDIKRETNGYVAAVGIGSWTPEMVNVFNKIKPTEPESQKCDGCGIDKPKRPFSWRIWQSWKLCNECTHVAVHAKLPLKPGFNKKSKEPEPPKFKGYEWVRKGNELYPHEYVLEDGKLVSHHIKAFDKSLPVRGLKDSYIYRKLPRGCVQSVPTLTSMWMQ
jgi:polyhydroxyalkanoate synthesis regulator phasin